MDTRDCGREIGGKVSGVSRGVLGFRLYPKLRREPLSGS